MLFALCRDESLVTLLTKLRTAVDTNGCKNIVNVDRGDVLDGGIRAFRRKTFKPEKLLSVRFSGEDGVDNGGLRREFMQLAVTAVSNLSIFSSTEMNRGKNLALDYKGKALVVISTWTTHIA